MRLNQNQMKMYLFMAWFVQSHKSLLEDGEQEIPIEEDADQNYNALYLCCKSHLEAIGDLKRYSNFYSIAQKLNFQIERMKTKLFGEIETQGCTLMMLLVGILRHCDFDKLHGFEDLKKIDLNSIIARAREENYLNRWNIQSLCRDFKFGYWEA